MSEFRKGICAQHPAVAHSTLDMYGKNRVTRRLLNSYFFLERSQGLLKASTNLLDCRELACSRSTRDTFPTTVQTAAGNLYFPECLSCRTAWKKGAFDTLSRFHAGQRILSALLSPVLWNCTRTATRLSRSGTQPSIIAF